MATRIARKRKIRTLQQNNTGTVTVSLPVEMIRDLGWMQGQKVLVQRKGSKITIETAPTVRPSQNF